MANIVKYTKGKAVIVINESFHSVFNQVPTETWDYETALNLIQNAVLAQDDTITTSGALSNTRGKWFEWMVSIDLFNDWVTKGHDFLFINLPNIRRFDSSTLYKEEIYQYVKDLRHKLEDIDINLVTSNPDYVIVDTKRFRDKFGKTPITTINNDTLNKIDSMYKELIHKCDLDDIVGYFSLKTSLRPDRRLQIAHEGSLTKATYVHLQTRSWLMHPRGIKYFGGALKLTDADIAGLKTVATHSITTVMSKPEKAVDKIFQIKNRNDLVTSLNEMIEIMNN